MRVLAASLLTLALGLSAAPPAAQAQVPVSAAPVMIDGALLTITADGETKIAPDLATINIGVVTQGATAEAALSANTAKMNAVVAAIKRGGVADRDIQTSNLSVNPQYTYGENVPPKLNGYEANNQVTVKVRALNNVGKVVDSVVGVGGNQVNGISFGLDDDTKAMDLSRAAAVKSARARAELYATAAGLKVDRIVSISEGGASPPVYPMMAQARMVGNGAPPPVAPGELTVTANVTVSFLLK